MNKQNYWSYVKKDTLPALFVGPVALMFALGLSLTAQVPVESGVIAVLIGALITGATSGSFVNISGPGVHSVAAWMMGTLVLGNGSLKEGFPLMLGASVISGVLILIIGLTRQVHKLDLIPISVRRGIIALLGTWIIIVQIPLLLGAQPYFSFHSLSDVIQVYPKYLERTVEGITPYWVTGLGLVGLVFMIIYSSYQNRLIRMIPAPIWLLIGGVGVAGYMAINYGTAYLQGMPQQIHFKPHVFYWFHEANFTKIGTWGFWNVVIGFTLVALNESVANLRTTDRMDVQHRRTDINSELAALGSASILSSLLGGLNVTATIAQSSTNVQLGATSKYSNFNHGIVVLLIVLFAGVLIEDIMVPVIAAMMLYIGYRMAAPSHIRGIAEIGWEDLTSLILTFAIGWKFGLLYGFVSGVFLSILLQLLTSRRFGYILRFFLRPNTLLYQEDNKAYLLSIKHYGSFLNLGKIRQKIDTVPSSAEMIVDFSLAKFVDYNVLTQLEYYEELFQRRGGRFEIVGADDLSVKVHHPISPWLPFGSVTSEKGQLSNRQEALSQWADQNGFLYHPELIHSGKPFFHFKYFSTVRIEGLRNRVEGKVEGMSFVLADVDFFQGEFIARGSTHSTFMCLHLKVQPPQFVLDKERLLDRVASLAGFTDINLEEYAEFNNKFKLKGANEMAIKDFFKEDLISLIMDHPDYHLETRGKHLLIFEKERLSGVNEMKGMVSFAEKLAVFLKNT